MRGNPRIVNRVRYRLFISASFVCALLTTTSSVTAAHDGFQTADKLTYQWLSGEGRWRFLGEGFSGTLSSTMILFGDRPAEDDSR